MGRSPSSQTTSRTASFSVVSTMADPAARDAAAMRFTSRAPNR